MKKIIIKAIALLTICTALTACKKVEEPNNTTVDGVQVTPAPTAKPIIINEEYDTEKGREEAVENSRLKSSENLATNGEGKIDFSDLPGVTYQYIGEVKEDEFTEAWIIKMTNANQYKTIVNKLNKRLEELRKEYAESTPISSILNDKDNIKIEEANGIVIGVFAPDAGALMGSIQRTTFPKVEEEIFTDVQPVE